ncbi:MAG: type II toxin-antitoxin system VapC family toxin, partial [Desulfobacterales bacterium]|nr:type II toxin-antitoxin system VapC family toxin [Desulfobacterales bacterium]
VLLDTHSFLWMIADDDRLSDTARETFLDPRSGLFFSAASLWEICIKKSLGKISLRSNWLQAIQDEIMTNAIHWLPIEILHCAEVTELPFHHRDPFDRLLIAQAMVEKMCVLSRDNQLSTYDIERIW